MDISETNPVDLSVTNPRETVTVAAKDKTSNLTFSGEAVYKDRSLNTVNLDIVGEQDGKPIHVGSINYSRESSNYLHIYMDKEDSLDSIFVSAKSVINGLLNS